MGVPVALTAIPNLLGKRLKILADIYHKSFFVL